MAGKPKFLSNYETMDVVAYVMKHTGYRNAIQKINSERSPRYVAYRMTNVILEASKRNPKLKKFLGKRQLDYLTTVEVLRLFFRTQLAEPCEMETTIKHMISESDELSGFPSGMDVYRTPGTPPWYDEVSSTGLKLGVNALISAGLKKCLPGSTVVITSPVYSKKFKRDGFGGLYHTDCDLILINAVVSGGEEFSYANYIIHEFGHRIEDVFSDGFLRGWRSEFCRLRRQSPTYYGKCDGGEMFAEALVNMVLPYAGYSFGYCNTRIRRLLLKNLREIGFKDVKPKRGC